MTFRSPYRHKSDGSVFLAFLMVIGAMCASAWAAMLVIGNFHHAGFPIPALDYWTTFWAMSPIYLFSVIVGAIKAFGR